LLDHGANVNDVSEEGWTALHAVADLDSYEGPYPAELAELLISRGADIEARSVVPKLGDSFQLQKYYSPHQSSPRRWKLQGHILK
jgi:ankyrin repeat protein